MATRSISEIKETFASASAMADVLEAMKDAKQLKRFVTGLAAAEETIKEAEAVMAARQEVINLVEQHTALAEKNAKDSVNLDARKVDVLAGERDLQKRQGEMLKQEMESLKAAERNQADATQNAVAKAAIDKRAKEVEEESVGNKALKKQIKDLQAQVAGYEQRAAAIAKTLAG